MSGKVYQLKDNQIRAVDPGKSVWLSASAGTGKTQVLSARVLRLLLQEDCHPSQILCLTFTKAGAAEMAVRVNEVLASWVRMDNAELGKDLVAIGADDTPENKSKARRLFASVLDCPGGGLRINTIHAFSQWLLGSFPEEAGLSANFRAIDENERATLMREELSAMVKGWQNDAEGGAELLVAFEDLCIRYDERELMQWLERCAKAHDLWFGPFAWGDDLETPLRRSLGVPEDLGPEALEQLCSDDALNVAALRSCMASNLKWQAKTGQQTGEFIAHWLALNNAGRLGAVSELRKLLFKVGGEPKIATFFTNNDPDYGLNIELLRPFFAAIDDLQKTLSLIEWTVPLLRIGRRFAIQWDAAKRQKGLVDFDDIITSAAHLLTDAAMRDWISFKLDRRFDHILLDEAQDTNEAQWAIIKSLVQEFYAGEGQRDGKLRTFFVVGDYKQAIYGFQGTSPENFVTARQLFEKQMADAAQNAALMDESRKSEELVPLDLGRSFRTSQPILTFVDDALATIGYGEIGLPGKPEPHIGDDRPGQVVFWKPILSLSGSDDESEEEPNTDGDNGEDTEQIITAPERQMADKIADQVSDWLKYGYPLYKGEKRNAGPGDILILVRSRKELAGLIVSRLYARGVPVAGVDRMRLGGALAVKDLMAALRFAALPLDDLSLACVLVSPLLGWNQDQLLEYGYRPKGISLWDHLRTSEHGFVKETCEKLLALLGLADREPVQALLHWILNGPWQGRRSLTARLGAEANDPINELLNAAYSYGSSNNSSLHGFVHWFDKGEGELKRDADGADDLVRVMTVHGSKGLQAPIVILADATAKPSDGRNIKLAVKTDEGRVPLPKVNKADRPDVLEDIQARLLQEEMREHWRLLYVAMTRAEEALFLGGALRKKETAPDPNSWYGKLLPLASETEEADPIWGARQCYGEVPPPLTNIVRAEYGGSEKSPPLPEWACTPIGPEPKPPRPLAPSNAAGDDSPDPPFAKADDMRARDRGILLHSLFERLPAVEVARRETAAMEWLSAKAADMTPAARMEICQSALRVISNPEYSALFSEDALAEVPLAATVGDQVIAGTVDRLLVTETEVLVVDFKTNRRPPENAGDIPRGTLRQMAAYVAALEVIYPGRTVSAAVLYSQTPVIFALSAEDLAPHRPAEIAQLEHT